MVSKIIYDLVMCEISTLFLIVDAIVMSLLVWFLINEYWM